MVVALLRTGLHYRVRFLVDVPIRVPVSCRASRHHIPPQPSLSVSSRLLSSALNPRIKEKSVVGPRSSILDAVRRKPSVLKYILVSFVSRLNVYDGLLRPPYSPKTTTRTAYVPRFLEWEFMTPIKAQNQSKLRWDRLALSHPSFY